ncbi:MAG: RHS repeat-associated core domain-containing protein [Polyangiaceae bacterium]
MRRTTEGAPPKGQRLACEYSGEADLQSTAAYRTRYTYDPETFRLQTLITVRAGTGVVLQSLHYTYDPVGNIVEILDNGAPVPIYARADAQAHGRYEYDALYRLTAAEGREHPGQQMTATDAKPGELPIALPGPNDTSGLVGYVETYEYDAVGNIRRMHHQPEGYTAWERRYLYANMPESGATARSNRLLATSNPGDVEGVYSARYAYADGTDPSDPTNNAGLHGSMTRMPHLPSIQWDYADRMQSCTKTVGADGERVYFTYDASGQRVRKVYEHSSSREERIYLGGYEVYRSWTTGANASLDVHRTTLHVMDDQRRVAMVENTIVDPKVSAGRRWRFQLDNHLGTATLEVDHEGNVISYEEYHPYGTSAVRVQRSAAGFSQKRYRYTGKERDEETGLYYHGARYYAPWLGRWTAVDPAGMVDGVNLYRYSRDNPIRYSDPGGTKSGDWRDSLSWSQKAALWIDDKVQSSPIAKGVVNNLEKRGESLLKAPSAVAEKYHQEGAAGVMRAVGEGVHHLVKDTGEAVGDIAYEAIHYQGDASKEKIASRSLDAVLNVADATTMVAGGAGALKGGASVMRSVAQTVKSGADVLSGGGMVTAVGVVVVGGRVVEAAAAGTKTGSALVGPASATVLMSTTGKGAGAKPASVQRGGRAPGDKGRAGIEQAKKAAAQRGATVRGEEVTVKTSLGRRRLDLLTDEPVAGSEATEMANVEVKTGASRYHAIQKAKDVEIATKGAVAVGKNAEKAGVAGQVIKVKPKLERY